MFPRIIALSDTHNLHNKVEVPECDIIIHAGDATGRGSMEELIPFLNWFSKLKSKYKVLVPGNHDWGFQHQQDFYKIQCQERGITLLIDDMADLDGLKIYGSPITPYFCNWAFNRFPGPEIQAHWDKIPSGMDIIVTHGPAYQILDMNMLNQNCGCDQLLSKLLEVKPKAHICGHLHENYGVKEFMGIKFHNVALCNEAYRIAEKPMEIIL